MSEWVEGPELTLHAGLTHQEIRCAAIEAAARCWQGALSSDTPDAAVVETAVRFFEFIVEGQ